MSSYFSGGAHATGFLTLLESIGAKSATLGTVGKIDKLRSLGSTTLALLRRSIPRPVRRNCCDVPLAGLVFESKDSLPVLVKQLFNW